MDPGPPEALAAAAAPLGVAAELVCGGPAGRLGMAPVLAAIALEPAEIGGELGFIIIDCEGPKQTRSLVFGTKFPLVDSLERTSLLSSSGMIAERFEV